MVKHVSKFRADWFWDRLDGAWAPQVCLCSFLVDLQQMPWPRDGLEKRGLHFKPSNGSITVGQSPKEMGLYGAFRTNTSNEMRWKTDLEKWTIVLECCPISYCSGARLVVLSAPQTSG
eukprot:4320348-Amphidinium_carterae.1